MVHQELAFCENLSVAENLCLGDLPARAGLVSKAGMRSRAQAMLAAIGAAVDVRAIVGSLTIAQQQLLQIASAVGRGARLIVFDEPTSSLSQPEAERLYALIDDLKKRGVTCIYVSHRLEEIFRLCDAITVLRDGRHVATRPIGSVTQDSLVEMMIGRKLEQYFPGHTSAAPGAEMLRVEGLSSPAGFADVSFSLHAGEVVGCAGLVGAGRSQMAQALFGLDAAVTGRIWVRGRAVTPQSAQEAIDLGIGLVPEDRKRQGLVLSMTVLENATLSILARLGRMGFVGRAIERRAVGEYLSRLRVRTPGLQTIVAALSGGNQQKIVLTKWLAANCPILIVDEPTRGVDVGAKAEIHGLIENLAAAGTAVLLISSELPEVLNLSSRILVFREGRIAAEFARGAATQESLMRTMAGLSMVAE
jgi:ABC-type sugar transport system ATPase subunit